MSRSWGPTVRPFWDGTPEQFYALYEKVAHVLKSYDPDLKVGGPAVGMGSGAGPYREGFIAWCADHKVPLDFFAWHHYAVYSSDPYDFVRISAHIRSLLDAAGLQKTEMVLSEWNAGLNMSGAAAQASMEFGAFAGAALIYLQDSAWTAPCIIGPTRAQWGSWIHRATIERKPTLIWRWAPCWTRDCASP